MEQKWQAANLHILLLANISADDHYHPEGIKKKKFFDISASSLQKQAILKNFLPSVMDDLIVPA